VKLNITITKSKLALRPELFQKYTVQSYDLLQGQTFSNNFKALIPRGTPEYVEHGEHYVERIMRALYHFKQCALIGPSGTGKSVCEGEPIFTYIDGRPQLTTVDSLFEKLARRYPTTVDQDGWETLSLDGTDLRVLSFDRSIDKLSWRRPLALARSIHRGKVVEVITCRNRTIKATPKHSFITEDNLDAEMKAQDIRVGMKIPIIRRIPVLETAIKREISIADYVPGVKLTERGAVVAGRRETIQIPAPPSIVLDKEFCWFMGFFVAEGYVGKGFASVYNIEKEYIDRTRTLLQSFGITTSLRSQKRLIELRIFSQTFVALLSLTSLSKRVGAGKGSQARYKKVPDFIFAAPECSKISFLQGFFDGDGWEEQGTQIAFGTSSKELANGLVTLCEQLGIFPTVRIKNQDWNSYVVIIARDGAAKLGIEVSEKYRPSDSRGHVEKIQITPQMIKLARKAYADLPSILRSRVKWKQVLGNFASGRMIGLQTLLRIADKLNSSELRRIANADILWDTVKEVRQIDYDNWVYDFQIPGTETFSSGFGGVLTHNTHIVYLVAEIAGLPLWEINCGLQTSAYDLFGRYVGLGKENWIDGQIVSWCRSGGILYLDEANMMKQDVATRLNPVLDTRGHLVLTEKDNEIIARNPAGYVIISMNPYSAEFAGTKPLNAAFRRRMSVWIDFDYLSVGNKIAQDEIDLVEKKGRVSREVATGIVRIGAELRRQYKANEIPYGPSVGDLVNWATLSSDGVSPEGAAEETIIAMTSDNLEIQETVRRIVHMVFAGGGSKNLASQNDNSNFGNLQSDKGEVAEQAQEKEEEPSPEVHRNRPKAHLSSAFESEYTSDEY
jgi:intein/homing endonuclease